MNKKFRDKIIAVLGAGLLGYYLCLSLFRGIIWNSLLKILPPINNRHLPDIYLGIIGAVVMALLGYLLFNIMVEKRSFEQYKKSYFVTIILMIILPLMVAVTFRVHAVYYVTKAESNIPTDITIRLNKTGNSIMFKINEASANGVAKSIEIAQPYLADFGREIRNLELKEVVNGRNQKFDYSQLTMWISYRASGKWYSKILSYDQGMFEERVAGERWAYYNNSELEKLIEKVVKDSTNINNYNQARIFNSAHINEKSELSEENFRTFVSFLNPEYLIQQDTEGVLRIKKALEEWVPKGETNIYVIELIQKDSPKGRGKNFMVYDNLTQTLMFEGKYYQAEGLRPAISLGGAMRAPTVTSH